MNAYLNGYDWSRFVAAVKLADAGELARADRAQRRADFRFNLRRFVQRLNEKKGGDA